jgi:hypothetical protein
MDILIAKELLQPSRWYLPMEQLSDRLCIVGHINLEQQHAAAKMPL